MRIIQLKQNSPEWEAWRGEPNCLGASDAPAICGVDKYRSPLMLYEQKLSGEKISINEFIEEKSRYFETRAHSMACILLDVEYIRDVCAESDSHPYIRASFDGICSDVKRFWECKYVGLEEFNNVKDGDKKLNARDFEKHLAAGLLKRYLPQLCQQAFVSEYRSCDFTVYNDQPDDVATIQISFDDDFVMETMVKVLSFRERVVSQTPPPLTHMDSLVLTEEKYTQKFTEFIKCVESKEKKKEKEVRAEIIEMLPHTRVECLGVKVAKSKKGSFIFRITKPSGGISGN